LSKKNPWKTDKKPHKDIYIKKYGDMKEEDIEVFYVDGEVVRNKFKSDFIEGGHGFVYQWIPNNEIWIEYGPESTKEAPFILLHEYVERTLMKYKKISYEKAHNIAAKVEFDKRPSQMSKEEVLALSPKQALKKTDGL
jgi:hypothetical protein